MPNVSTLEPTQELVETETLLDELFGQAEVVVVADIIPEIKATPKRSLAAEPATSYLGE